MWGSKFLVISRGVGGSHAALLLLLGHFLDIILHYLVSSCIILHHFHLHHLNHHLHLRLHLHHHHLIIIIAIIIIIMHDIDPGNVIKPKISTTIIKIISFYLII